MARTPRKRTARAQGRGRPGFCVGRLVGYWTVSVPAVIEVPVVVELPVQTLTV